MSADLSHRTFRDFFSGTSAGYAQYRPRYPRPLFEWIARESRGHSRVWDCGTGNGQAATALAEFFTTVIASDASAAQLAVAERHPRVRYLQCRAEAAALAPASVDCVTVAQAVHWFDMPAFFREAARVARPGALVAVWTYGNSSVAPDIDAVFVPFYRDTIGAYWPKERRCIEDEYREVPLPFDPVDAPAMTLDVELTLAQFLGYISTWSAIASYIAKEQRDPMDAFARDLAQVWGDPSAARLVRWPMTIRAGRV